MKLFLLFTLLIVTTISTAQEKERFILVQSDKVEHDKLRDRYKGNVEFIRGENYLYCDSAYYFIGENKLECFGNVKVIKSGFYTLTGDHLIVNEEKGKVVMKGNVFLRKNKKEIKRRRHKLRLR